MVTNERIVRFLKTYSLFWFIVLVILVSGSRLADSLLNPKPPLPDLGSLEIGEQVYYKGHQSYITSNEDYGGSVWIRLYHD